jgi:hypothetical protein
MRRRPGSGARRADAAGAGADERPEGKPGAHGGRNRVPPRAVSRNVAWACKMRRVPLFACFRVRNRDGWNSVPPAPPPWGAGDARQHLSPSFPNGEEGTYPSNQAAFPHQPVAEVYKSLSRECVEGSYFIAPLSVIHCVLGSHFHHPARGPLRHRHNVRPRRIGSGVRHVNSVAAHQVSPTPIGCGVSDRFARAMSLLRGSRGRFTRCHSGRAGTRDETERGEPKAVNGHHLLLCVRPKWWLPARCPTSTRANNGVQLAKRIRHVRAASGRTARSCHMA